MKTKQSKFIPRLQRRPLALQPRDLEILVAVYQYRYLKRDQIQSLLNWDCLTRVNARLRKLFDTGYLHRTFLPVLKGSSQAVYSLGKNGIDFVSQKLGKPVEEVRKQVQAGRKSSPLFLGHSLYVSEARMKLTEALKNAGATDDLWLNDLDCTDHFTYQNERGRTVKRHFKPDSYCRFIYGGKIYSFFLELDTGTMRNKRIQLKARIYQEYRELGLYTQRYGLKNFRVLFVVTSEGRAVALKSLLESEHFTNFWFVNLADIISDAINRKTWSKSFEAEKMTFLPPGGSN